MIVIEIITCKFRRILLTLIMITIIKITQRMTTTKEVMTKEVTKKDVTTKLMNLQRPRCNIVITDIKKVITKWEIRIIVILLWITRNWEQIIFSFTLSNTAIVIPKDILLNILLTYLCFFSKLPTYGRLFQHNLEWPNPEILLGI